MREALDAGAFVKAVLHDGVDITHVAHYGTKPPAHLLTALRLGHAPGFAGMVCDTCGAQLYLELDHVNPRANGGAWSMANIRPRCWPCHTAKTERDRKAGLLGGGARGSP